MPPPAGLSYCSLLPRQFNTEAFGDNVPFPRYAYDSGLDSCNNTPDWLARATNPSDYRSWCRRKGNLVRYRVG
jgi:hypothetical protein